MADENLDLVSKLTPEELAVAEFRLQAISPDDGKYGKPVDGLREYLSADAEWRTCAFIQKILLETRLELSNVATIQAFRILELNEALKQFSPLNAALLEERVTRHDQLAVIEEIGRHISPETKALLHLGTTSYDILEVSVEDVSAEVICRTVYSAITQPNLNDNNKIYGSAVAVMILGDKGLESAILNRADVVMGA